MFNVGVDPTADELNALIVRRVRLVQPQDVDQVGPVDTSLVVPVDGLSLVDLSLRYKSGGGGIRWCWVATGTVACQARDQQSAGLTAASATAASDITTMRHRSNADLDEQVNVGHMNTSTAHLIRERLVLDGQGTVMLRVGQSFAHSADTVLHGETYAIVHRIEDV